MRITIGTNEQGQRTDKFVRKWLQDLPLSALYKAFRKGDIRVNGKKVKENYFLQEGDVVETSKYVQASPKKELNFQKIENVHLKITFEDENILLVEKWPGVLVHADKKNGDPTLTDYVLSYLHDKGDYLPENEVTFTPASCNRLDRNTSGIVIFGKTFEGLKALNEMVRDRKVQKYYMALVQGKLKDGRYDAYISKDESQNLSKIYNEGGADRKKISMEVKTLETVGSYSLLDIELITGRSHQLRAHLSHLGNPIVGDSKYGDKKLNSFFNNKYGVNYQFLYAYKLIFRDCPEKIKYMENKTIAESLPPVLKKIKNDTLKFF